MEFKTLIDFLILCFFFDFSPGVSFFAVAKNSIHFGIRFGLLTALGVALNDGLSSIFAWFFLSVLSEKLFYLTKITGISIVILIAIKNIISSNNKILNIKEENYTKEKNKKWKIAIKEGFLISFFNPGIAIGNASLLSAFTINQSIYVKFVYHFLLFGMSLLVFSGIGIFFGLIKNLRTLNNKNIRIIVKILSFLMLIFAIKMLVNII